MLKAILFDLDGTLTDTDSAHFLVWQQLLIQYDLAVDLAFYKKQISGKTNAKIIRDILPNFSQFEALQLAETKEQRFRDRATLERLSGLDRLLTLCRSHAIRRAVVTNAPRANADHMLQALGLMTDDYAEFETIVLAEDLPRGKPNPDPYLEGLRRLGVAPEVAIAFEDTPTGVRAAVAAGLTTIGVRTTYEADDLTGAGATLTIANFNDGALWTWLRSKYELSLEMFNLPPSDQAEV